MSLSRPGMRWWVHGRVRVWLLLGCRRRALGCIHRALQTDPSDAYALATQAHVLAEQGDKAAALQALARWVALAPEHSAAWFNYGFLSEELGLLEQAEAAFLRAIALDPQLDRAWYGLGLCLIRQRRWVQAVAALKKNTELQPMSPCGWYQLARVHLELQEPDEAQKIIRHLRGFEPKVAAQLAREAASGAVERDALKR